MTMLQWSPRRAKGYIEVTAPEAPNVSGETLQCCHCGGHWIVKPGSGTKRGFCYSCNAVHCGSPSCWDCKPQEKVLEEIEAEEHFVHLIREQQARDRFDRDMLRLRG